MGTFETTIEVGDAAGLRFERLEALVDSGATYLMVPKDILASSGCEAIERRPFSLADGHIEEYEVGIVSLRLNGRTLPAICVFGDDDSEALLGAVALESFLLAADPVNKRLIPVTGRLM